jgi:hypothetical protein
MARTTAKGTTANGTTANGTTNVAPLGLGRALVP